PAALAAFPDIDGRDALAVLQRAPDPSAGATLSLSKISSALKVAGRQRSIDARAREIQTALRSPQLHTSDQVVAALSASTTATVA
ncbi:IS110 family transposase, partial [Mycobacterium kansasii]